MHIITPEYCKSIAEQLNEKRSFPTPCVNILFSLLRAFWLLRQKRYEDAEKVVAFGIENIVKHYNLK